MQVIDKIQEGKIELLLVREGDKLAITSHPIHSHGNIRPRAFLPNSKAIALWRDALVRAFRRVTLNAADCEIMADRRLAMI